MKRFVKGGVTKRRSREGVDERERERKEITELVFPAG